MVVATLITSPTFVVVISLLHFLTIEAANKDLNDDLGEEDVQLFHRGGGGEENRCFH